jgi:hypothetical protein
MKRKIQMGLMGIVAIWLANPCQNTAWAGGLNVPPDSDGGKICKVETTVDDATILGSFRRFLDQGYNFVQSGFPSFCTEKIVFNVSGTIQLTAPIVLDNPAAQGFTMEKQGSGGDLVLDASALPKGSCAIEIKRSNQVTLRGLTIKGAGTAGVCIDGGSHQNTLEKMVVSQSGDGVWVKAGSEGNLIENGAFFDNNGYGVKLDDANQNTVTKNALYRNASGAIASPATDLQPQFSTGLPNDNTATTFAVTGKVPAPVDHVEIFRASPEGDTNYILSVMPDPLLNFFATIDASAGEGIFGVGIGPDGSTGPSSDTFNLVNNPGGANGTTCEVTSLLDDVNTAGSVRLALNRGYSENDPTRSLCTEKISFEKEGVITLHSPITLDNLSRPNYTLEKGSGAHGDVVLDGSQLPAGSCVIVVDANQITLRGISIQNPNGEGICIRSNRSGTLLDQMTVTRSVDGVDVQTGARNSIIQEGSFHDNSGFGVKLEDATQNRVTQNALYLNSQGPLDSPATDLAPAVTALVSASSTGGSQYNFMITGTVPSPVEHVEVFRATLPSGATTNYVGQVNSFNNLRFSTTVAAQDGEDIFLVSIKADGTTSSVTTYHLDSQNVSGGGGTNTTCDVTNLLDDTTAVNSLRRAIDLGYSDNNPATTLCSQKISLKTAGTIVLQHPIVLNNTSRSSYVIEKDPTVTGEVILDASSLPPGSCAITADANQITLRGITIQNPSGDGVCIASNRNGNLLDQITVRNSKNGAVVNSGAEGNTIQNGSYHNNTGFGIKLVDATSNRVTQNAIYLNTQGPLDSPAADILPTVTSLVSASLISGSQYDFTITGTVPNPVEHIEIFTSTLPLGSTTNYVESVNHFTSIGFVTDITALDGQDIFLVAIKADGTTSAVGTYHLSATSATGADGIICSVTSPVDDATAVNSIRWALTLGYMVNDPTTTLCSHKISFKKAETIVLQNPIVLNNTSRADYIIEKDPTVTGEVILDGSLLPAGSCAITADANQLTLRGITIQNPNGDGVCIAPNRNGNLLDQMSVRNSRNGAVVAAGAQGNTLQNGSYHNNTGFGVKLDNATQNRVTHNALYQNAQGPLSSPATDIMPAITSEISASAIMGSSNYDFALQGTVSNPVEHIEIYRSTLPMGATTNFSGNVDHFTTLGFVTDVTAMNGEDIFLIGIKADGTTSSAATFHLNALGAAGGQGGADGKTCAITTPIDDPSTVGSLSWALNVGYQDNNPSTTLCSEKISIKNPGTIVLQQPIDLNNTSRSSFTIEKDPAVTGDVVLDGSKLPAGSCAITVDANNLTLRGITIQNPNGDGVCISSNHNGALLDQITVRNSHNGAVVKAGAQSNTIQNGSFHDNIGVGIKLEDATFNRVTQNALYHNSSGPIESPAVQIAPAFYSSFSNGAAGQDGLLNFSVGGQEPMSVNHVEIFRLNPISGTTTNFVKSVNDFDLFLRFTADVPASNGEQIFAIAVGNDGTTSSATSFSLNPMAFGSSGCSLQRGPEKIHSLGYLLGLLPLAFFVSLRRRKA